MKADQREDLMEKKIKRTEKASNSIEERTIIITIFVAIAIMGTVLVAQMVLEPVQTEYFSAMYVLDSEKQAENYPKTVILGTNSTFTLWVGVENQNGTTVDYSVQLMLDDGSSAAEPVECFNRTVLEGETWEFPVTINIDHPGNNKIIFELWFFNTTKNEWDYTGTRLNLSVEATQQ